MLFTISLAEKLGKRGVKSFSLHPGGISTGLQQHVPQEELNEKRKQYAGVLKTLQQGCATTLVAAFDPSIDGRFPLMRRWVRMVLIVGREKWCVSSGWEPVHADQELGY